MQSPACPVQLSANSDLSISPVRVLQDRISPQDSPLCTEPLRVGFGRSARMFLASQDGGPPSSLVPRRISVLRI